MKKKYVRIVNKYVVDVSYDPWNEFYSTIAAEFVEAPEYVSYGFIFDGKDWVNPKAPPIEEEF